ncbi:MAG: carbohydrate-binding protein [Bacteroidales bacterium]
MMKNLKCLLLGVWAFIAVELSYAQIEDFQVGNTTRQMLVYAPSTIVPGRPLLISMHGYNQDINYQKNQTQWETIAKENNFVVVYPAGLNNSWDISGNTDIDFILAIIDEMVNRYGIDRERVYLSGFSMGGMMTYYAATKIADKIAAFAPVSGYPLWNSNISSSRPVPIIHVHGTADDVVAYSGVQPYLNGWIARDSCPTTAVITKPYPPDKPNSNGTRYYWGPGTDSVEIVLISITGVGHWHSIDPNGVNTSKEIWDFCKKFSLGFGVPKFKAAYVLDADPKQIMVTFTKPIKSLPSFEGFSVKVDGLDAAIDTIVLADSVHIAIVLKNNITKTNEVTLSYGNGNVVSVYNKALVAFNDTAVDNQLYGSAPKLVELAVTESGDSLVAQFNKKMLLSNDISSLELKATFNGQKNISLLNCSFLNNDSTTLVFQLSDTVYADYQLALSYTGNSILSVDSGVFKNDTAYIVKNKAKGLPVHIVSASVDNNAIALTLVFSKPMAMIDAQIPQLALKVNGKAVAIKEVFNIKNTVKLNLYSNLYYGDTVTISYTPGNITAADKGSLEAFTDFLVENPLPAPIYVQIPGKVEAENYTLQFGTATENTSDAGGGLNVGWTETGDWLVYAIENNTNDTEFKILFRLAAQSAGPKFDYYLDDVKIGTISVPSTGAWQTFTSVIKDISVPKGKHYLKIVTVTGGFNINYFDIEKDFVGITTKNTGNISIYPNPASNEIAIKSPDFRYNRIQITDMMGRLIMGKSVNYAPEMTLPLSLKNGDYFVVLRNGTTVYSQKISITK